MVNIANCCTHAEITPPRVAPLLNVSSGREGATAVQFVFLPAAGKACFAVQFDSSPVPVKWLLKQLIQKTLSGISDAVFPGTSNATTCSDTVSIQLCSVDQFCYKCMEMLLYMTLYMTTPSVPRIRRGVWLSSGSDQAPCQGLLSLKSSRPMSMRRISEVPAPISYSFASRSNRPVGYSFTYPLPPSI